MPIRSNKRFTATQPIDRSAIDIDRRVRRVNKTRALEIAGAVEKRGFTFPVGCLASKSTSTENSWSEIRLTRLSHVRVNDYGNVVANGQFYTALFFHGDVSGCQPGKSLNLIMFWYTLFQSSYTRRLKKKKKNILTLEMEIFIVHFYRGKSRWRN